MINLTTLVSRPKGQKRHQAMRLKLKLYKVISSDRRLQKASRILSKTVPDFYPSPF